MRNQPINGGHLKMDDTHRKDIHLTASKFARMLSPFSGTLVLICVLWAAGFSGSALAQQEDTTTKAPVQAVDLSYSSMTDEEFTLRLVHLTSSELEEFASEWGKITRDKTKEVAEINIELSAAEGVGAEHLRATREGVLKQRNGLFRKLEILLKEWEAKGAKPESVKSFRDYISAVRRSQLKATDVKTQSQWIIDWLTSADGGRKVGLWSLGLLASLCVVLFLTKIVTGFVRRGLLKVPQMSDLLRNFISGISYWLILGVGIILALSLFGINMTPLLAVFGGASFIIGFAMQSTLGNLASGLLLMITKPFDVGDVVDAAGVSGTVRNVSIVSTTILTFDNQVIVVPNTMVWESVITNVNASDTRRVDLMFGIGYDDDIELAKKILGEILTAHPLVLDDPAPNIRMNELADSSVNFICRPWAKTGDYWTVYWDVLQQAKEKFDEAGLSIPFPQSDVHIHQVPHHADGESTKG
jgi:small conductance mechanosensitive channel